MRAGGRPLAPAGVGPPACLRVGLLRLRRRRRTALPRRTAGGQRHPQQDDRDVLAAVLLRRQRAPTLGGRAQAGHLAKEPVHVNGHRVIGLIAAHHRRPCRQGIDGPRCHLEGRLVAAAEQSVPLCADAVLTRAPPGAGRASLLETGRVPRGFGTRAIAVIAPGARHPLLYSILAPESRQHGLTRERLFDGHLTVQSQGCRLHGRQADPWKALIHQASPGNSVRADPSRGATALARSAASIPQVRHSRNSDRTRPGLFSYTRIRITSIVPIRKEESV